MEFRREDYSKYNTTSIIINNTVFRLKDCDILKIEDTKYGYQKAIVKLSREMIDKMKQIEKEVNDYLENKGLDNIKLVYGNKMYAKKKTSTPDKHLRHIKLKGVFINNEQKSFVQLWVM